MADFKTHVTFSSVLGAGYAVAGTAAGVDLSTSLVAGGLCGVAGMLPDVDSDSGVPRREAMGFAAAIVPMLLLDRFDQMHFARDQIILAGAALYFLIRFTAADLIGKFSVHRGMWHSIPAVLIFAGLAFLIAGPADNLAIRYFKAFAVGLGALSHLVLDEVYSVDTRGVVPKFKKSFGTAVKFWSKKGWANFSTYAKLAVVLLCIFAEPQVLKRLQATNPRLASGVQSTHDALHGFGNRVQHGIGRVVNAAGSPNGTRPPSNAGFAPAQQQLAQPQLAQQQPAWRGFAPNATAPGYAQQSSAQQGYPQGNDSQSGYRQQSPRNINQLQPSFPAGQSPYAAPQPIQQQPSQQQATGNAGFAPNRGGAWGAPYPRQ